MQILGIILVTLIQAMIQLMFRTMNQISGMEAFRIISQLRPFDGYYDPRLMNWVGCVSRFDNLGLEPGVFASSVVYCTGGAVGLHQLVVAFYFVTFAFFRLFLLIMRVPIYNSIFELVMSRRRGK
jgi:hypothetical protein